MNIADLEAQLAEEYGKQYYNDYAPFLDKWYPEWNKLKIEVTGTFDYDDEGYSLGGETEFNVYNERGRAIDPQYDGFYFDPFSYDGDSRYEPALEDYEDIYRAKDSFMDAAMRLELRNITIKRRVDNVDDI